MAAYRSMELPTIGILTLDSSNIKHQNQLIRQISQNELIKQFEDKLIDRIGKEIKRGKLEGDVKDITLRMFREFYQFMWMNRSYWEPRLKNA